MIKTKITFYLALIFLAGAVAGGAVARKYSSPPAGKPSSGQRHTPDEMQQRIFGVLRTRLNLTEEQVQQIEPVFKAGFRDVCSIQEKCLATVEDAVRRNHEEIGRFLTPEQRQELAKMDEEHRQAFRKHGSRQGEKPVEK